ncbi:MAG: Txe/YoeB family addiction module toxin [Blastochloris sp.]|nr:Txe/YoeB family addiction module toxin [Blastochloris sp.]
MSILFSTQAWQDYLYWQETDKKTVKKINELIKDIAKNPFQGLGKPEPLKHALSGFWSRRISQEHRIVYRVGGHVIELAQLRYHY